MIPQNSEFDPFLFQERSSSIEDGFLCNCEFGESSECCIFHKNSLRATTAPAPISSTSLDAQGDSSVSSTLEGTNRNTDSCHGFDETHTNTPRESDSGCKLEEEEATQNDVDDLISAIDLGLEIPNFQLMSFNSNHSTSDVKTNSNSNSTVQNFTLPESKLDCTKSTSGVAKNSKRNNGEIRSETISGRDDSNDHRVKVQTTSSTNTMISSSEEKLSISDTKQRPIINHSNYNAGSDCEDLFPPTKQNLKFLDVPSSFNDVPNAKSPCGEEFDKFSEDSFFTESDCNSLIGGIIQNMVGV